MDEVETELAQWETILFESNAVTRKNGLKKISLNFNIFILASERPVVYKLSAAVYNEAISIDLS